MLFNGPYFYLSTFYPCDITLLINGRECKFSNVEAAFQAQRVPEVAHLFETIKGLEAKKLSTDLPIKVPNWEVNQVYAMANALHAKYLNPGLLLQLKEVDGDPIRNDVKWNDPFWGLYHGIGHNILGRLLTNIRDNNNNLQALKKYIDEEIIPEIVNEGAKNDPGFVEVNKPKNDLSIWSRYV